MRAHGPPAENWQKNLGGLAKPSEKNSSEKKKPRPRGQLSRGRVGKTNTSALTNLVCAHDGKITKGHGRAGGRTPYAGGCRASLKRTDQSPRARLGSESSNRKGRPLLAGRPFASLPLPPQGRQLQARFDNNRQAASVPNLRGSRR